MAQVVISVFSVLCPLQAGKRGPVWEMKAEDFDEVYRVNVRGVFLGMKYQIPAIKAAKGGVIINNASVVGTAHYLPALLTLTLRQVKTRVWC